MRFLDFLFSRRPASAGIAKERLQIVLAHERASRTAPDFLPALQRDLLAVVGKYVAIKDDLVRVNLARQSDSSVLEINIEFDPAAKAAERATPPVASNSSQQQAKFAPPRGKSAGKRR